MSDPGPELSTHTLRQVHSAFSAFLETLRGANKVAGTGDPPFLSESTARNRGSTCMICLRRAIRAINPQSIGIDEQRRRGISGSFHEPAHSSWNELRDGLAFVLNRWGLQHLWLIRSYVLTVGDPDDSPDLWGAISKLPTVPNRVYGAMARACELLGAYLQNLPPVDATTLTESLTAFDRAVAALLPDPVCGPGVRADPIWKAACQEWDRLHAAHSDWSEFDALKAAVDEAWLELVSERREAAAKLKLKALRQAIRGAVRGLDADRPVLPPDQFDFGNGVIGRDFAIGEKHLLEMLRDAGNEGRTNRELRTALAGSGLPLSAKAVQERVKRTRNRISDQKLHRVSIESVNRKYVLLVNHPTKG